MTWNRNLLIVAVLLVAGTWGRVAEGQVRTFTLGGALHVWETGGDGTDPEFLSGTAFNPVVDTTNTPGDRIEFAARRGWVSPSFFDGQTNIASLVLQGGKIDAPNASTMATSLRRAQLEGTVNGDHDVAFERKPAPFQPIVPAFGIWIILDFGRQIGVERIRFYPRNTVVPNPNKPFHNDFLRGYEVWVNDQLTNTIAGAPDKLAARNADNNEPIVEVELDPQYVRLIKLRSLAELPFEVDEIEVFGTGYLPQAEYLSDLIDLGGPATVGPVRWRESVVGEALFSELSVRMRSGLDNTPILYQQQIFVLFGGVQRTEVTGKEYWALERQEQALLVADDESWSPWKRVTQGALNPTPTPRQFVQFGLEFAGELFDTRLVDELSFDYLQPPLADSLRAEVFPRSATAEESVTFRYAILLRGNDEIHGFDRIEVDSNAPVEDIGNVTVNGRPVEARIESSTDEGFSIALPLVTEDESVVELSFDIPIFRFGTTFSGRAINSQFPEVPQRFEPGQVVDFGPTDIDELSGLTVAIPKQQIGRLVGVIDVSNKVVTPNGDGVNDVLEVQFNLLQIVAPAPVILEIYDLSGRRVHRAEIERGVGPASLSWDGTVPGEGLAAPGVYVWRLRVDADAFDEVHSGVVGVVY